MPAAYPPELKEKVKLLAGVIGIREAARRCKIPQATAQAWSAREDWEAEWSAQAEQIQEVKDIIIEEKGLQPLATMSPSEVLAQYGQDTKLYSAKTCHDTAKCLSEKDPDEMLLLAQVHKMNVDSSVKVFGWDSQSHSTNIAIQINGAQVPDIR